MSAVALLLLLLLGPDLSLLGPALASPTPSPADVVRTPPEELVTPGTIGFLVTFAVAVALVLLLRDMVRRQRGIAVRAERRDAQQQAVRPAGQDEAPGGSGDVHGPDRPDRPAG